MDRTATSRTIPVACFAPSLTDEILVNYETLINGMSEEYAEAKDVLRQLLTCVKVWWDLPVSTKQGIGWKIFDTSKQAVVIVQEIPLEDQHVKDLWEVTPWMRELVSLSTPQEDGLFDRLPKGDLYNMARHLLWYCKEITLDREPMTSDVLK